MSGPPRELRHELKFVCEERAWPQLRAAMRLLPAALAQLHPPRVVQSVYLDTHEGRALGDNQAGIAERQKLRFRWYGEAAARVRGTLEWKRRQHQQGDKEQLVLDREIAVAGATRHAFVSDLRAAATALWRDRLCGREPAQWVRYHRDYWSTADGSARLTIDRDLRAFDLRDRWVLTDDRATPLPRILVVECKAPVAMRTELEALLQQLPLVVDKCSKFALASAPREGPIVARWDRD